MRREPNVQHSAPLEVDAAIEKLFPKRIIDQSAYTVDEMCERSGLGRAQTARKLSEAVAAGEWEEVYKVAGSGRTVKAYRPKK